MRVPGCKEVVANNSDPSGETVISKSIGESILLCVSTKLDEVHCGSRYVSICVQRDLHQAIGTQSAHGQ